MHVSRRTGRRRGLDLLTSALHHRQSKSRSSESHPPPDSPRGTEAAMSRWRSLMLRVLWAIPLRWHAKAHLPSRWRRCCFPQRRRWLLRVQAPVMTKASGQRASSPQRAVIVPEYGTVYVVPVQPKDTRSPRQRCVDEEVAREGNKPSQLAMGAIDLKCSQR